MGGVFETDKEGGVRLSTVPVWRLSGDIILTGFCRLISFIRVKYRNEFKNWDSRDTIPLLEFRFNFVLPKPRKERNIIIRNQLGQIVRSEVPLEPIYP